MAIYKSAKKLVAKQEEPITNAEYIRIAPHGLYFLISEFHTYIKAAEEYNMAAPNSLTATEITFLYEIHHDLDQFLNPRPLWGPKKNIITKSLRTKVELLKTIFIAQKTKVPLQTLPHVLSTAVNKLIDSTLEFVEAFVFLDGLLTKVKNRPADWVVKKRVAAIILRHQKTMNTSTFPKFPAVLQALNRYKLCRKYQLSARNYGNLKQQWDRGTYWYFIQP
jgi:hypothetical protein